MYSLQRKYVEDEIHFVCVCKIYDFHRKKLYDYVKEKHEMFEHLSDENKFYHFAYEFNHSFCNYETFSR